MLRGWKFFAAMAGLTPALVAQAAAGEPVRMRVCVMDVDYAPFGKLDGTGTLQYLARQGAARVNLRLDRYTAPRRRCLEEIKSGISDAMVSAYSPLRGETAVFPMAGGVIDASKALGVITYHLYRRKGSPIDWDGVRFTQLQDGRLGVQAGFIYITDRFTQLGVPYDDGAKALEHTLAKLAAGRVEGVVAMKEEADHMVAQRYPGQIERTSKLFEQTPVYMMVSRQFYQQHPQLIERYWQEVRQYRGSYDYRRYQMTHP